MRTLASSITQTIRLITALGPLGLVAACQVCTSAESIQSRGRTTVSIVGAAFQINGKPTYQGRVPELIRRVKQMGSPGHRLLVSTFCGGGAIPDEGVVRAADFILVHGNGVSEPRRLARMVQQTRAVPGFTPQADPVQ